MPIPWHLKTATVLIRKVCVGRLENNAYVVACAVTRKAVLVDAADEADRLLLELADVEPMAILTTHGHWDHVGAAAEVSQRLGIPFRIHVADAEMVTTPVDEPIASGAIDVGHLTIEAIHTPGHTQGSVTFSVEGVLLTGDTLFPGGPGGTASKQSFGQIIESLETAIFSKPDQTLVFPGHGLDTTIGAERPNLAAWRARGW